MSYGDLLRTAAVTSLTFVSFMGHPERDSKGARELLNARCIHILWIYMGISINNVNNT